MLSRLRGALAAAFCAGAAVVVAVVLADARPNRYGHSDLEERTNDIRIIAASGGDPIELTVDQTRHEMSPAVSPDGRRIAFVAFDAGVPRLYVTDVAGGRTASWREVRISALKPRVPTGRVRVTVLGPDGQPMPSPVRPRYPGGDAAYTHAVPPDASRAATRV